MVRLNREAIGTDALPRGLFELARQRGRADQQLPVARLSGPFRIGMYGRDPHRRALQIARIVQITAGVSRRVAFLALGHFVHQVFAAPLRRRSMCAGAVALFCEYTVRAVITTANRISNASDTRRVTSIGIRPQIKFRNRSSAAGSYCDDSSLPISHSSRQKYNKWLAALSIGNPRVLITELHMGPRKC